MEFGARSKEALLSLEISWMFVTILTSRLWMIYGVKGLRRGNIMRLGLFFYLPLKLGLRFSCFTDRFNDSRNKFEIRELNCTLNMMFH